MSFEVELDSSAIRALGVRFKLTQVFLRDNGWSSDNLQASSFPKHTRFKYDSDDSDDDNIDGNNGEISSKTCIDITDSITTEHDDLTQQMNALGLPTCFKASKQRGGKTKRKTKATQIGSDYLEDIEMESNDLSMQDIPASAKRKKKRKNRTRKKSSHDNEGHEFQPVEEDYVDLTKYWCQRYLLFSRFDFGVKMDDEGWFSVTPEAIARHQASRCSDGIILDCFADVGGNTIQFARNGKHVFSIDIDPKKIEYAHHNATIYGVEDRINFIIGDSLAIGPKVKADTVFLSPPWGGPDYAKVDSYDINMLQPYDGQFLFDTFKAIASTIVMFLPRNVDIVQLAELALSANSEWSLEVEKNFLNGKLKAVTAYFSKSSEQNDSLTI